MGVKFAHAFGAHTVVFTTSPKKKDDALRLGADEIVLSTDANEMAKHAGSFDFILDAVAAEHDINAFIGQLRRDGNLTMVGAPEKPLPVSVFGLILISAASTTSPPTSRSFPSRRSTKPTNGWPGRMSSTASPSIWFRSNLNNAESCTADWLHIDSKFQSSSESLSGETNAETQVRQQQS